MTSDELLTRCREALRLAEAATPEPWRHNGSHLVCSFATPRLKIIVSTANNAKTRTPENLCNADFIAASRTLLPEIAAAVIELLEGTP